MCDHNNFIYLLFPSVCFSQQKKCNRKLFFLIPTFTTRNSVVPHNVAIFEDAGYSLRAVGLNKALLTKEWDWAAKLKALPKTFPIDWHPWIRALIVAKGWWKHNKEIRLVMRTMQGCKETVVEPTKTSVVLETELCLCLSDHICTQSYLGLGHWWLWIFFQGQSRPKQNKKNH